MTPCFLFAPPLKRFLLLGFFLPILCNPSAWCRGDDDYNFDASENIPNYKIENETYKFPKDDNKIGGQEDFFDAKSRSAGWYYFPALNVGYNMLRHGYKGFDNLGKFGLDFYAFKKRSYEPVWTEGSTLRLSLDYFPLQTPEGLYGLTEDIYSVNAAYLLRKNWGRNKDERAAPAFFLGLGPGYYIDRTTLDTPASGRVTGSSGHFGVNASLGVIFPVNGGKQRFIFDARGHSIRYPQGYWAENISYQAAYGWTFGLK